MVPVWLHDVSLVFLTVAPICALIVAADEIRRPQHMWIMNVVWPVTALFGGPLWLWLYFRFGRLSADEQMRKAREQHRMLPARHKPFAAMVAEATSHCGAGCTLGDILAETAAFAFPVLAVWFGWHSLFAEKTFAVWILDFVAAYLFGIVFQYFTIAPMRGLGLIDGIWAAIKADTLSLAAWQIGMYAFMAFAKFYLFGVILHANLAVNSTEFWFSMQIAMLCGFATSYPANWWLLRSGLKEKM
jgi:hypothetical protein